MLIQKTCGVQQRAGDRHDGLSDSEYEILVDLALGLTDKAIAKRQGISKVFDINWGIGQHVLLENGLVKPGDVILGTDNPNMDLLPGHIDLVGAEIEMIDMRDREQQLKAVLEPLRELYDFIVVDCSPSLGLVTVNSLTASDSVIVPVQCEYFALEGLGKLLNTIKIVQQRLNPELVIEGMLLTMYDSRLRLANQVVEEVKTHFQQLVFDTVIHRNVALGEAPSHGQTIIMHDATSKGAVNYLNLAREILQKNSLTRIPDNERTIAVAAE
mgnify:CR=1 FL=1